jgi:hypothetical protein
METIALIEERPRFNKKDYNKEYLQRNKEKYNKMSRERNQERYYTDEEYRQKIIERAKLSVYRKRMEMKNMI